MRERGGEEKKERKGKKKREGKKKMASKTEAVQVARPSSLPDHKIRVTALV